MPWPETVILHEPSNPALAVSQPPPYFVQTPNTRQQRCIQSLYSGLSRFPPRKQTIHLAQKYIRAGIMMNMQMSRQGGLDKGYPG